jgi:hypothetical protein
MRPRDDAPTPDEFLPDLLADTRARTDRAKVADALDAIDGALTNNIRPLTGAGMSIQPDHEALNVLRVYEKFIDLAAVGWVAARLEAQGRPLPGYDDLHRMADEWKANLAPDCRRATGLPCPHCQPMTCKETK